MDLEAARQRLEERRRVLIDRTGRIESDLRTAPHKDSKERVTESENDEVLERLGDVERAELQQIDRALSRIVAGAYADCESCGEPIDVRRLDAVPDTTRCVSCA